MAGSTDVYRRLVTVGRVGWINDGTMDHAVVLEKHDDTQELVVMRMDNVEFPRTARNPRGYLTWTFRPDVETIPASQFNPTMHTIDQADMMAN